MSMGSGIVVQKYGGSSLSTPNKIKAVASFIEGSLRDDVRLLVVVSAMGHATNELLALAQEVSQDPPKRELDMLITCGERSSMALLAMTLSDLGVTAISLTGSQSGIITDNNHGGATIKAIRPARVLDALSTHRVVIIAGFQGVSTEKEITTLRRGGSDTTAVAMAFALKARACEIYTDVAGVMDGDPRIMKKAQLLKEVASVRMEAMALYGARVLAHDAARLAVELEVEVSLKETLKPEAGTEICTIQREPKKGAVLSITHLRAVVRLLLDEANLKTIGLSTDYFLCASMNEGQIFGYFSNDISQELRGACPTKRSLCLITVHLSLGQVAVSVLQEIKAIAARHQIPMLDIVVGHREIFIVVEDGLADHALLHLHQGLLIKEAVS